MKQQHADLFVKSFVSFLGAAVEHDAEYRNAIGTATSRHALPAGDDWTKDGAST